jgi:hypothetical protein
MSNKRRRDRLVLRRHVRPPSNGRLVGVMSEHRPTAAWSESCPTIVQRPLGRSHVRPSSNGRLVGVMSDPRPTASWSESRQPPFLIPLHPEDPRRPPFTLTITASIWRGKGVQQPLMLGTPPRLDAPCLWRMLPSRTKPSLSRSHVMVHYFSLEPPSLWRVFCR